MKKFFLMLALLFPTFAYCQEAKFMGLNLGTDVDVFCKVLKEKGMKQTIDRFERKEFDGTFATYPGCRIIVMATEVSKKVKSVEVVFESVRNKKYDRDKAFSSILEQYRSKYGDKLVKTSSARDADMLGITNYEVKCGDVTIYLHKTGPSFLSPDDCSMSISYVSSSLVKLKEANPNKHSSDI